MTKAKNILQSFAGISWSPEGITPLNPGTISYFATLIFAAYSAVLISILLDTQLDLPFWNYYSLYHQSNYEVGCISGVVFESHFQVSDFKIF